MNRAERREIAENLRNMTVRGRCSYEEQFYELLGETVIGSCDFYDFDDVAERLADLIDPEPERTCLNMADNYDGMGFVCSKCTRAVPEDEYDPEIDEYCSGCGAKVIGNIDENEVE